jgi:hypothetical protein
MPYEGLKEKIEEWIREEGLDILKEIRTKKHDFVLTIKSREQSIFNFPIKVISSKRPEGVFLEFTRVIKGQDNRSYRGTAKFYREKILQKLSSAAEILNLHVVYSTNIKETKFRAMKFIMPSEITKVEFFTAIWDLKDYRSKLDQILKK